MDRLEIERLIGEVAKRHNVLLSRDDPILITVTLNEIIIARALERLETALTSAQNQIAAGAIEQVGLAKTIAGQLITAAADYVASQVRAGAADAAERMRLAIAAELESTRAAASAAREARLMAWWAAGVAIVVAAIIGVIAALYPLRIDPSAFPACRPTSAHQVSSALVKV